MTDYGHIVDVRYVEFGSFLVGDHAAGTLTLQVEDAGDFYEDGGSLTIDQVTYAYDSADLDLDTITLVEPLAADAEDMTRISPFPLLVEKQAVVVQDGSDEGLTARVPHSLFDRLPEGIREESMGESVTFEEIEGEWTLTDILGDVVTIDGTYIDPDTMPSADLTPVLPDGVPPAFSPTPTVSGGIGSLFIKWMPVANHDPVTYDVHISTEDGFTPDDSTLIVNTAGSTLNVKSLADGSELVYDTDYFVRIVARDVDGPADPSQQDSGSPVQVTSADIAADYVYAGQISVDNLIGGTLTSDLNLAAKIKTADQGQRVEIDNSGVIVYKPDNSPGTVLGGGQSTFKGQVEAEALTVTGGSTFRSADNEIATSGVLNLAAGVTPSQTAPTTVVDWATLSLKDASGNPWPTTIPLRGLANTPDGKWISSADQYVYVWNADGTFNAAYPIDNPMNDVAKPTAAGPIYGIRTSGSNCYVSRLTETTLLLDNFTDLSHWTPSGAGTATASVNKATITAPFGATETLSKTVNMLTNGARAKVGIPSNRDAAQIFSMSVLNGSMKVCEMYVQGNTMYITGPGLDATVDYTLPLMTYWSVHEFNGVFRFTCSSDNVEWYSLVNSTAHGLSDATLSSMTWQFVVSNPTDTPNLLKNADFETGTISPWVGATITSSGGGPHSGSYMAVLKQQAPNGSDYSNEKMYQTVAVVPGQTYAISGWLKPADYTNLPLFIEYGDFAAFNTDTDVIGNATQLDIWNYVSGLWTAPAGVTSVHVGVGWAGSRFHPAFPDVNYVDDMSFTVVASGDPTSMTLESAQEFQAMGGRKFVRDNATQTPVMTHYSGSLYVAEVVGGKLSVKTVSPSTLAVTGTNVGTSSGLGGPLLAVERGSADYGTDSFTVLDSGNSVYKNYWTPHTVGGSIRATEKFDLAVGANQGIAWNGTNFYSLGNGVLYKHEAGTVWTTESDAWKARFAWATAAYESLPSVATPAFTMKKRARLTITSPALPTTGDNPPDRIKVYVTRGTDTFHLQTTTPAGATSAILTSINWSGAAPLTATTFPDGIAAKIVSTDGSLSLDAKGVVKAKTLTVTDSLVLPATVTQAATAVPMLLMTKNASTQDIPATTWTEVTGWNIGTQQGLDQIYSRVTIQTAGLYLVTFNTAWTPGIGRVLGAITLNDTAGDTPLARYDLSSTTSVRIASNLTAVAKCVPGDIIRGLVYCSPAATLAASLSMMSVVRIGPAFA